MPRAGVAAIVLRAHTNLCHAHEVRQPLHRPTPMRPSLVSAIILSLFAHQPAHAQQRTTFQQLLTPLQVAVTDPELAQPFGYVALSDGSVVGIDLNSPSVTRYAADGRKLWRVGRAGSGPGEFRIPYRIALMPDQSVLIYDMGLDRITRIDSSGKAIGSMRPDMKLSINSMLVTPNGEVLIAGFTTDARGKDRPLHLFSKDFQHKRSFGDMPIVTDARFNKYAGPGYLSALDRGGFLHMRESPYEMIRYPWDFAPTSRTAVPIVAGKPEEWIILSTANGRGGGKTNPSARKPRGITQLDSDLFLGGTNSPGKNILVLFDGNGTRLDEIEQPAEWMSVAAYDRARRTLWIYGERDLEPVLYRLPLRR